MRIYIGIKFRGGTENKDFIERISALCGTVGVETVSMERDLEAWGSVSLSPHDLMAETFKQIDESDAILLELAEKGVGLGIEAGYAFAHAKPIYILVKSGTEVSKTMEGIATGIIFHDSFESLSEQLLKHIRSHTADPK